MTRPLRKGDQAELQAELRRVQDAGRAELDALTAKLIEAGLADWSESHESLPKQLIVRGQANLLEDLKAAEDLERIRILFADIEAKTELIDLLGRAEAGDGVRIFIGSENNIFSLSGSSMIAAPFRDGSHSTSPHRHGVLSCQRAASKATALRVCGPLLNFCA